MRENSKVSVWIAHFDNEENFNRFTTVNYNDEREAYSSFMETMEIEYIDEDKQETIFDPQFNEETLRKASLLWRDLERGFHF